MEMYKISKHKKPVFYCKSGQTLAHVGQRGSGSFIWGDIQNSNGCSPEQPTVADPS